MDFLKSHADTVVVLGAIVSSLMWMNGRFNDVEKDIGSVRTEIAIIKTVMVMKNIMPSELVENGASK